MALAFFVLSDGAKSYMLQMLAVTAVNLFAYSLNTIITCSVFPAGNTIYDVKSMVLSKRCFSLSLAVLGMLILHWPGMLSYIIIMSDEIIKTPWIYPRYRKYIWLKNITRDIE